MKYVWDYNLPKNFKPKSDAAWEWYLVRKINYGDFKGLKRKIIKAGHIEKAHILDPVKLDPEEVNKYPSLKWGLIAFLAGLGLIIIEVLKVSYPGLINYRHSIMPVGIELVFISLGFLIYFFIMNMRKK